MIPKIRGVVRALARFVRPAPPPVFARLLDAAIEETGTAMFRVRAFELGHQKTQSDERGVQRASVAETWIEREEKTR